MDADGWLTKADAATRLGVGERTVERLAARGALTARMRPGFPTMYNPEDVDRMATAGHTVHRAALAAVGPESSGNGHGAAAMARRGTPAAEQLLDAAMHFLEIATTRLAIGPTGPTGPTAPPGNLDAPWLTEAQALWLSGLALPQLQHKRRIGHVQSIGRGATRRYWRAHVVAP